MLDGQGISLLASSQGSVLMTTVDIRKLMPSSWRHAIGVLRIRSSLSTITSNVVYGNLDTTSEQLEMATCETICGMKHAVPLRH